MVDDPFGGPSSGASFLGPDGEDALTSIRKIMYTLTTPTVGDQLYCGQVFRSRILQRTAQGLDVDGSPFAPYSTKGPYYFYPNRDSAGGNRQARVTAAQGRHKKTGGAGTRTPLGIRYDGGYAEAKEAHGRGNVDLFGLEQHVHMLNTLLVKAGGIELTQDTGDFFMGNDSELDVHSQIEPAKEVVLGFYGPEAERAKGNNEGTGNLPARHFFGLSDADLMVGEQAIAERMEARARSTR